MARLYKMMSDRNCNINPIYNSGASDSSRTCHLRFHGGSHSRFFGW